MNNYIIYMHYNKISDKSYIGQTIHTIEDRWKCHIGSAKYSNEGESNHFQNALRKYESNSWEHIILEDNIQDKETLNEREIYWISYYDTFKNGYNSTEGGGGALGMAHSDETKQKLSEINTGKTHSDETKRKLSELGKGRIVSDETRKKLSESNTGKTHSDETKRKLSELGKGRIISDETRKKLSESNTGKTVTEETKKKMREAAYKRPPVTDETKRKLSEIRTGKTHSDETKKKIKMKNSKPVIINDVVYKSVNDAVVALNISNSTISYRIRSDDFPTWVYCVR